jgi:hypothetical protein
MAMVALAAFSMSNSNLISVSTQEKGSEIDNNLGMKKSRIDDKQYLDYL